MIGINRTLAVVRAKPEFLHLMGSLPDPNGKHDFTIDELNTDCTTFLIPLFDEPHEAEEFLDSRKPEIFENELLDIHQIIDDWDVEIDSATFDQYFYFEIHSVVLDLVNDEQLIHEED